MCPYGNSRVSQPPFSAADLARIIAEADPAKQLRDILDPPYLRELRRQQKLVRGPADQIREAFATTKPFSQVVSAVERYRSPARDVLDSIGAGPVERASKPAKTPALPEPQPVPADGNVVRSVADLGLRVREARRAMGMTQQRFADMAGVGRRFLVELEKGKPSLEIGRVLAVCQAAGLKLILSR